jgi:hypothetical protein
MKKNLVILTLAVCFSAEAFAGTESKTVAPAPQAPAELFRAGEIQIDASFTAMLGQFDNRSANGLGGTLGVNYFFTRYFGIGIDNSLGGAVGAGSIGGVFDSLQAEVIARYPLDSIHLAPYAMIGGGATWGNFRGQGNGNLGGGLEYRISPNIGTFIDCRYLYGNKGLNESLSRIGLRFAF